jgi:hypothetical protein
VASFLICLATTPGSPPLGQESVHPRQIRARAIGKMVYQLRARHRWAMNIPNAIFFLLMIAFMSGLAGLVWALYLLAHTHSLLSFIFLCAMTFAIMATASYAVDHWQRRSQQ